jgi:hypothetical protein
MKFGAVDLEIAGDFRQNSRQSLYFWWIVCWNSKRSVVFPEALMSGGCGCRSAVLLRKSNGAAIWPIRDRKDHEAASRRNNLILHDVKPDDGWGRLIVEMTPDRVAHYGLQFIHGFA